ncbi:hypothetical protein HTZ97_16235 [Desulfuromonas acetoxidans]|uniref:Uncharacterized protein n=1 Tax=Desulfuromonas acetoxidans (strain DSM 684 / 11070) TaxID=281689 RepID=Q1K055_DESA6|nr:hypothetical protein [Desulfuromonas acetoxidans]EAT16086.1 hypothetical protein Dace_2387 [Desulfuromonas acetoxidans DSM 684]MBF0646905.1 hypothetical protein [Desulfuromonas acetoxidans]NVD26182.1 hypothetical protein [Desulfuromonas acetoxidans]NVE18006.1 hypothetical protein [Desulfuromonas acetoxidans]
MQNHVEVAERCYEESLRIGKIIYLAANPDQVNDDLAELFEDYEDTLEEIFGKAPNWVVEENYDKETLHEWLMQKEKFGFLVHFETPVRKYFSETSCSFGWGYYSMKWIYSESLEDAIEQGISWAKQQTKEAKQQFLNQKQEEEAS